MDADGKEVEVSLTDPDPVLLHLQDDERGAVRRAVVLPGLFRLGQVRHRTLQHRPAQPPKRSARSTCSTARRASACRSLNAGDIGAVVKLKDTHTGNTLVRRQAAGRRCRRSSIPRPNIHASLKSSVKGEEDKIASGLAALHHEDPTFLYLVDSELHQTIISAQGELHLEVIAEQPPQPLQRPCRAGGAARALPRNHQGQGRFQIPPQKADRRRGPVRRSLDAHRARNRATPASNSPTPSSARTWTACLCRRSRKAS